MDNNTITALIAGIAGLVTVFFGRSYWKSFSKLIDGSQEEVARLRVRLESMQVYLDTLERQLHQSILERERLASRVDDYATRSQLLLSENEALRYENKKLKKQLAPSQ